MSSIDELAAAQDGRPDPKAAAEQLTALLDLGSVGLHVTAARIVGRGSQATADLYLSDGTVVEFERLRDLATPKLLAVEIAASCGACPSIRAPQAVRAVALVRALAEHRVTVGQDELAVEWGREYLQAAETLDVDLSDQAQRWDAFSRLDAIDPDARRHESGVTVAKASTILRDADSSRLIRTGWFRAHVRGSDAHISPADIATRMERIGWRRPGQSGRIKATRPGFRSELVWTFYVVAEGWENDQ